MTPDEIERAVELARETDMPDGWDRSAQKLDDAGINGIPLLACSVRCRALSRAVLALAEERGRMEALARLAGEAAKNVKWLQEDPETHRQDWTGWLSMYDAATRREE